MVSLINSTKHVRKKRQKFFIISSRHKAEGNTSYFISRGQHYPNTRARSWHFQKGKLQTSISHKHRCRNLQQNVTKSIQQCIRRILRHDQWDLLQVQQGCFNTQKSNNEIFHNKRLKNKHMTTSTDAGKPSDKIQHPFTTTTAAPPTTPLSKLGTEGAPLLDKEHSRHTIRLSRLAKSGRWQCSQHVEEWALSLTSDGNLKR